MLAKAVGGDAFFGFVCAVAFAAMLAVVAGLTLSGVATLSHDVWVNVIKGGDVSNSEQLKVARASTILIAVFAVILGIVFEGQNVAFMAGLAFSIACAANFPSLVLAIMWKRFTTAAAVWSILTGTLSSVVLILFSPTIQVDVLGKTLPNIADAWWFVPLKNPAIICMPLSFVVAVSVSLLTHEKEAERTSTRCKAGFFLDGWPLSLTNPNELLAAASFQYSTGREARDDPYPPQSQSRRRARCADLP